MHEALLYKKNGDQTVNCSLCRHLCHIRDGKSGICMVRENKGGTLYSIFYGRPCATAVDPIEKKPLFHFLPATKSFSIATLGCNFKCEFCQNWDISQMEAGGPSTLLGASWKLEALKEVTPSDVVNAAINNGCRSISYTYSEPTIFYEYAKDIAILAKQKNIANILVTNGYMTRQMLFDSRTLFAAANVDLKAFKKETYKKIMKADLDGVLDSIVYMKKMGIWIEVTTLIVPGMNDSEKEVRDIAEFIAENGCEIPWHISRFHPQYKMKDRHETPFTSLKTAYETGKKAGLKYVYMGNIPHGAFENTYCWKCGEKLIERDGFFVKSNQIEKKGKCPKCKSIIDGVF